jgi:hypothetical protein
VENVTRDNDFHDELRACLACGKNHRICGICYPRAFVGTGKEWNRPWSKCPTYDWVIIGAILGERER